MEPPLKRHVFVCTNERPDGHRRGCCSSKDAPAILKALKEGVAAAGLRGEVRAQRAGCLDVCEKGASLVVYPEAVWYGGVTPDDVPELIESHIKGGKPVERLRIDQKE